MPRLTDSTPPRKSAEEPSFRAVDLGDRSPRDPRRTWARFTLRERPFRNPAALLLAEWADAIEHDASWEAWCAAHPEGPPL